MPEKKYDLEDRLLMFAASVIRLVNGMHDTQAGRHVADHLLRAGTSPLLNHGEAQAAESRKDFIHKFKICLKELNEVKRCLRLTKIVPLLQCPDDINPILQETEELKKKI